MHPHFVMFAEPVIASIGYNNAGLFRVDCSIREILEKEKEKVSEKIFYR